MDVHVGNGKDGIGGGGRPSPRFRRRGMLSKYGESGEELSGWNPLMGGGS